MPIADLRIENFRGIRTGHIRFGAHTVFIGPNNCGKTTVIEALALLFGRDRMVRSLTEHDFFEGDPQPADRIRLVATIIDFDGDEPADHTDWFRDDRGVIKWWKLATGAVSAMRDDLTWRLACQIGFSARFDRPSLEVETARYFHDDDAMADVFVDEVWTAVPARLIRDIGFFLVPASRTWDRVVSFGSELFRRVVASGAGQPAESVLGERDRLRAPQQPLEADSHLEPIIARLNAELAGFFRTQPRLHLRVTATDSDGLLEAVVPHYAQAGAALALPARRHGSGLISLQHLLLCCNSGDSGRRRTRASGWRWKSRSFTCRRRCSDGSCIAFKHCRPKLLSRRTRRWSRPFRTRKPLPCCVNEGGALSCVPLLAVALPAATPNAVLKLFHLNRVDTIAAIMHDVVLVPEGRTDHDWLKLLVRAVDLRQSWAAADESRFGSYIGVVPTHDAAVEATTAALSRLHPRITVVVDGDGPGVGYAQALAAAVARPASIIRWPDGWTLEDVAGWILEADQAAAIAAVAQSVAAPPATIAALVARLKSEDRAAYGLKQDQIAYEAVADVIGSTDACCRRARELLNAMTDVLLGGDNARFTVAAAQSPHIRIFQP